MARISLRAIRPSDQGYFAKWWRDKDLLAFTSGIDRRITDDEVGKYFSQIYRNAGSHHFMITLDAKPIGHIALQKRRGGTYETQVVIGEKQHWNKGYGTRAIRLLIKKAVRLGITRIFLEVRPDNVRAIAAYKNAGFKEAGVRNYPNNLELPQTLRMTL